MWARCYIRIVELRYEIGVEKYCTLCFIVASPLWENFQTRMMDSPSIFRLLLPKQNVNIYNKNLPCSLLRLHCPPKANILIPRWKKCNSKLQSAIEFISCRTLEWVIFMAWFPGIFPRHDFWERIFFVQQWDEVSIFSSLSWSPKVYTFIWKKVQQNVPLS